MKGYFKKLLRALIIPGGTTALGKEQECQIGLFVSIYLLKNKTILLCKLSRGGLLNNEC